MKDTDELIRLHAVESRGLRRLDLPRGIDDVSEVFDRLPRGIYEALRTFDHVRFIGLAEHLERAERSMAAAGLGGGLDRPALHHAIHAAVLEYPGADCKLRLDVLAGPARELGTDSRLILALAPFEPPPPKAYRDGVGVGLIGDLRREDPLIKSADWVVERRRAPAASPGDQEPVMLDEDGYLLEGVQSNFFAAREGTLHTAGSGVLAGVTRGFVLDLYRAISVTFRSAVRCGNNPPSWMTYPMRRRRSTALSRVNVVASNRTSPVSGSINPFISRRIVDFPQPLGPINTVVRADSAVRSVV